MKTILTFVCAILLAGNCRSQAGGKDDALWGALVGGALGVIVGENSGSIRTEHAVPAFAALGALAGYAHGRYNDDYDDYDGYSVYDRDYRGYDRGYRVYDGGYRGYDNDRYYGRSHYRSFGDYDRDYHVSYPYWPRPIPRYRRVHANPPPVQTAPTQTTQAVEPPANLHPGVTVVRVPVQWPNGMIRQIRLLRVSSGYVGPQGERYDELPDATILSERYVPAS